MERLKLHNYGRNTEKLHSLMCSAHNIEGSKGQFIHLEHEEEGEIETERDDRERERALRFSPLDRSDFCKN